MVVSADRVVLRKKGVKMAIVRAGLMTLALVVTAFSVETLSSVSSLSAAGASPVKACGVVHLGSHSVHFTADNVPCSFAMKYAHALAKKSLATHRSRFSGVRISGGPSGWTCSGGTTSTPVGIDTAGTCVKGLGVGPNSKSILWSGT